MKLYKSNLTCTKCKRIVKNIPNDTYAFKRNDNIKLFNECLGTKCTKINFLLSIC